MKAIVDSLLFQKTVSRIDLPEFKQRLLSQDAHSDNEKIIKKAFDKVSEIEDILSKKGRPEDWLVSDIPEKYIVFVKSQKQVVKQKKGENILFERDPVKILGDDGNVRLLAEVDNSIIGRLSDTLNFVPNVFCSPSAYALLVDEGVIPAP